jgi:hydroxyacylglutathione hydrolase
MFFEQFYLDSLGHASYLLGDERTGQALVFDPRRDVDVYFESARRKGLRIAYVMDSHGHNDYLSGITEIRARQDVVALGFAGADLGYDHRSVRHGEVIELGDIGVEVMHTPGHTPEHVSLLVYDRSAGPEPALMLSGGALLVGDVARPDLLGGPEEVRAAARTFCRTIQERLLTLPDDLEVFPTHVAGSLCAANIGSRLSTTLGYERKTNEILAKVSSSDAWIEECLRLDNLPVVPPYWRRMRAQNLGGVAPLGVLREPPALGPDEFERRQRDGAIVLDVRAPEAFGGAHVPGALNVGMGASFPTWAGTVLPEGREVLLVLDRPGDLWTVTWELLRIGYAVPAGWLAGGMHAWRTAAKPIETLPQITVFELHERLQRGELSLLDVRQPPEWATSHVEGARFVTGAELPTRVDELLDTGPLAVTCGSGYRSSVAASLLKHRGKADVVNVAGGMSAWAQAGLPMVS